MLEVGAGIGTNAKAFLSADCSGWWCLEPDARLAARISSTLASEDRYRVVVGTIHDLEPDLRFDAILYVDVLEHIADDVGELAAAAGRLRPGGSLLVLAPAHEGLTSALDRAVGHLRRYTRATLRSTAPSGLECVGIRYLDSLGMLASLANRLLMRQNFPTAAQVKVWDTFLVPGSILLDPVLGYRLGKSVLGIWRRPDGD